VGGTAKEVRPYTENEIIDSENDDPPNGGLGTEWNLLFIASPLFSEQCRAGAGDGAFRDSIDFIGTATAIA